MEVPKMFQDGNIFGIVLHIINATFLVAAIAGVFSMVVNMVNYKHYLDLLGDNTSWAIAVLVVGIAVLLIIIAAIGILGTLTQNTPLLKIYVAIIAVFMTLIIIAGAVSFAKRKDTFDIIEINMIEKLKTYLPGEDEYETIVWDDIQQWYECCGVVGFNDWAEHHLSYRPSTREKKPGSCSSTDNTRQYVDGCLRNLDDHILAKHWNIGGAIFGINLYLLLAIGIAYMVIKYNDGEEFLLDTTPSEKGQDNNGIKVYPSLETISSQKEQDNPSGNGHVNNGIKVYPSVENIYSEDGKESPSGRVKEKNSTQV